MITPRFVTAESPSGKYAPGTFVLAIDRWDDYHFKTAFHLKFATQDGLDDIGWVKVGMAGMKEGDPHLKLPRSFVELGRDHFSVGQDREYYENLMRLPSGLGTQVLRRLRDIAADDSIYKAFESEPSFSVSLMRSVTRRTVTTQFRRISLGRPPLTPYKFTYVDESAENTPPFELDFAVDPEDNPPTNVHVLIGANGVGKSTLLRSFVDAVRRPRSRTKRAYFRDDFEVTSDSGQRAAQPPFANLVHISFSAFDPIPSGPISMRSSVPVHLVGLNAGEGNDLHASLVDQFLESVQLCSKAPRSTRWRSAIRLLADADRLLADENIDEWLPARGGPPTAVLRDRFSALSSGHKIVVLTITRLVELVEEQSLVLLDEPETHLHPPLLSALVRAVSDLIVDRNGVAILATHSPVVLQEVARDCVWVLQRSGQDLKADHPEVPTFGESVSRLTSEVFRLDVLKTGYHAVLQGLLADNGGSATKVLRRVELGSEAAFVLTAMEREGDRDV